MLLNRLKLFTILLSISSLLLISSRVLAQITNVDNFIFNPYSPACFAEPIAAPVIFPEKSDDTEVFADQLTQQDKYKYLLKGNVVLRGAKSVVKAETMSLDKRLKIAKAFGKVHLYTKDFTVLGGSLYLNQKSSIAKLSSPIYQINNTRSHGSAKHLVNNQQNMQAFFTDATLSTCKIKNSDSTERAIEPSPDNVDWQIRVSELEIDSAKKMVYGKHGILYFYSLPVLYTPYFQFSTAKRNSGILTPTIGGNQSITQKKPEQYFSLPIYINLAPEFDDTLTLTKMQDRGTLFGNEFRYLQNNHQAVFTSHFIDDKVSSANINPNNLNLSAIDKRWDMHINAQQNWGAGFSSNFDWSKVSDRYFYADMPFQVDLQEKTYLARNANINYQSENINAHVTVADFIRLQNNQSHNYAKKPEVGLDFNHDFSNPALQNFRFNLTTEVTEFEITETLHSSPEALRAIITPSLRYDVIRPYGLVQAELSSINIHYEMQDNGFNTTGADTHDINIPQFALKGGLTFIRDFKIGSKMFNQTLEPQIQYLYTGYQDQSNIARFDTSSTSLDFSNLFAYNRFSGFDRIGDSNQVSMALTSKLLNNKGKTLAELGIGQIFFLADQKVQLSGNGINTDKVSDYFIKLGVTANILSVHSTAQVSKESKKLINANSRLKLDLSPEFTFLMTDTVTNLNLPGEKEEVAAGFNWQMTSHWSVASYMNYDFTEERQENLSGAIRYDDCCWASELSVKQTKLDGGLYNYSFQYLIELKGLSTTGIPFKQYLTEKLDF